MATKYDSIYQFKISLNHIQPSIWRRIQVPSNYSFWDLHVAIQDAMGWSDSHLHEFDVPRSGSKKTERIGIPDDEAWQGENALPGWEHLVKDYLIKEGQTIRYTYDFGDDWQHKITLEKILPVESNTTYPVCIGGARACPPEDCGGIMGYENLLAIMDDPDDEEHESMLEWYGGIYDAEAFDQEAISFSNPKTRLKAMLQSA